MLTFTLRLALLFKVLFLNPSNLLALASCLLLLLLIEASESTCSAPPQNTNQSLGFGASVSRSRHPEPTCSILYKLHSVPQNTNHNLCSWCVENFASSCHHETQANAPLATALIWRNASKHRPWQVYQNPKTKRPISLASLESKPPKKALAFSSALAKASSRKELPLLLFVLSYSANSSAASRAPPAWRVGSRQEFNIIGAQG